MKDSSERRIIHHRVFNDSRAEYDEWWTMQYKTKFLWKTVWRDVCYYTEAGPIQERWFDEKKVKKLAKHYGIEMPL